MAEIGNTLSQIESIRGNIDKGTGNMPGGDTPSLPEVGGGGSGGAYGGLDIVNQGSSQIGRSLGEVGQSIDQSNMALDQGRQALGGDGGGFKPMGSMPTNATPYKKGGAVNYTDKSGRLNLGSSRVSTATKNKSNSSW